MCTCCSAGDNALRVAGGQVLSIDGYGTLELIFHCVLWKML